MNRLIRRLVWGVLLLMVLGALAGGAWLLSKRPQRDGVISLTGLTAPVSVRYDEAGVPHLKADHETDLYRALGYVHAQDRLFQMEMLRRLARGELAEILGPSLVSVDRLFRTLTLRDHADAAAARLDPAAPSTVALRAYLDGVNQYQRRHPAPIEFDLLRIPVRPFTEADTLSVAGYLAYSFAAALRTEPVLSRIRDQLGAAHLAIFTPASLAATPPAGAAASTPVLAAPPAASAAPAPSPAASATSRLSPATHRALLRWAQLGTDAIEQGGVPFFEGSNAWAVSGARTASGKPLLAGDPHISFAAPAVWYEAHLSAPGIELYGHFQPLQPFALIGHGPQAAWSLTMFQNDDMDLIAEKPHPSDPNQVWSRGAWVALETRETRIRVKGEPPVALRLRRSPHGPVINEALEEGAAGAAPLAMWWAFLETENPALDGFYQLNRAVSLPQARAAAEKIHAPGLNIVWAHAGGDIAWWAAARLVQRPPGVRADLVLDGASADADKPGFLPFSANPQEENPARGYIVSANHEPAPAASAPPVAGYYNLPDRARRLEARLQDPAVRWSVDNSQALQLDTVSDSMPRMMREVVARLRALRSAAGEAALLERLSAWDGSHAVDAVEPTVAVQLLYDIARAALADELGEAAFKQLTRTRALDHALPRLVADPASPWWDRADTPAVRESRDDILQQAWAATLAHLEATFGADRARWTWGRAHTLTHAHPLGKRAPLDRVFNVGPLAAPGGRETPNNLAYVLGPAPWAVVYGPSTRRLIDLATPGTALGINPVGQSGVRFDRHYDDQAAMYLAGRYRSQHLLEADVRAHTRSQLLLRPG